MKSFLCALLFLLGLVGYANSSVTVLRPNGINTTKPDLATAATSADCAGKTVVVTSPLSAVQSNISSATVHGWPSDRTLEFRDGGSIGNTTKFVYSGDTSQWPTRQLFTGSGTVVINTDVIEVAWFPGTDASSKWAACAKGIQNTNGLSKVVRFSTPNSTDAWATTFTMSGFGVWGPRWRVDSPIIIDSPQQNTTILTPGGFVCTASIPWMWQIGTSTGANKVDYIHFPDKLSIEGNNGLCQRAGIMYGSSHMRIPYQEIYRTAGWLLQPTQNKQVSDVKFDFMDSGGLYGPILTLDGSAGANNSITDFVVDFINSTGFASGHAPNALVQMNSNYHGITIGKIVHRGLSSTGSVDATGSVVSLTNVGATAPGGAYYPPRYGINIGPITNGSSPIVAQAVITSDGSGGVANKFKGITIGAGSIVDGGALTADISLFYTDGAVVQGLTRERKLLISSDSIDTQVYGVQPADVIDAGSGTLINGKSGAGSNGIQTLSLVSSPTTWINTYNYDVDLSIIGGAVTGVTYTRGGTSVAYPTTSGVYRVSPGDNISFSYTTAPTVKIIGR
ncbi:hypothetical protein F6V30_13920 [Oryzomonas sagensis]|uniref:Uncharacterized protein n=1 Tax=Oryzomonas sagensis TaxID=2603857 RepID=A0ABQ6TL51_9BACT|nr:hypothetical protein [Oryzomonas sagensis]KAB0668930.1 hypothetical protein F6V30_13920 [Oryzomonas sagensis]